MYIYTHRSVGTCDCMHAVLSLPSEGPAQQAFYLERSSNMKCKALACAHLERCQVCITCSSRSFIRKLSLLG